MIDARLSSHLRKKAAHQGGDVRRLTSSLSTLGRRIRANSEIKLRTFTLLHNRDCCIAALHFLHSSILATQAFLTNCDKSLFLKEIPWQFVYQRRGCCSQGSAVSVSEEEYVADGGANGPTHSSHSEGMVFDSPTNRGRIGVFHIRHHIEHSVAIWILRSPHV